MSVDFRSSERDEMVGQTGILRVWMWRNDMEMLVDFTFMNG